MVAFSGAVMPGPLLTYTIQQSLVHGTKSGFIIIIGHALLELLVITLIFLGFDILLQSSIAQIGIGVYIPCAANAHSALSFSKPAKEYVVGLRCAGQDC